MRSWRLAGCLGVLALSTLGLGAGQKPAPSSPLSPELRKLDVWTGHWIIEGEAKDTAYSRAMHIFSDTTCAWSSNRGYMICDQLNDTPTGRINQLSVYTYDEKGKAYKFFGLDQAGEPRSTGLTIAGNIWTYHSEFEDKGKHIQFRTINDFRTPGNVIFRTEYSEDNGAHWILVNSGADKKDK